MDSKILYEKDGMKFTKLEKTLDHKNSQHS